MSSIENKVVSLTFDNAQFEAGIAQSMASLQNLRASIDNVATGNGFGQIQAAADSVNLSHIADSIEQIKSRFSAMGAVAFSVIQRISNSAMNAGQRVITGLLDPLIEGGRTRALQIENARFQFQGLGMDVERSMAAALDAVKGTAYGLGDAAQLAGVFGAAGIEAGQGMTDALRGVAGVAALTNRSFTDIGMVFQDIATLQHVTTNDLNSLAYRGLGIQKIADAMGMSVEELRLNARDGTISFEEFTTKMNEAFGDHAVRANETFTGSLANMRAAMSRIGAEFFTTGFAGLRVIFNSLTPVIDSVHEALMPLIDAFKEFVFFNGSKLAIFLDNFDVSKMSGTLNQIPQILQNIWRAIKSILKPIRDAFNDIFPPGASSNIEDFARAVKRFTENLQVGGTTAHKIRNIFRGVFSIFSIGWEVIKGVAHVFGALFSALTAGGSPVLDMASGFGKMLMHLQEILVDGGGVAEFFDRIARAAANFITALKRSAPIRFFTDAIKDLSHWLGNLFGGDGIGGLSNPLKGLDDMDIKFGRLGQRLGVFQTILDGIGSAWAWVTGQLEKHNEGLANIVNFLKDTASKVFGGFWDALKAAFSTGNFSTLLDTLNIGVLGGLAFTLKKLIDDGLNFNFSAMFGVNAAEPVTNMIDAVTGTLEEMQTKIKAEALMEIAKAVAVLVASMVVLALIDSAALARALGAMAVGMGQLMASLALLDKIATSKEQVARLAAMVGTLVTMAAALLIFSFAVAVFGAMDLDTLAKGLGGAAAGLIMMALASKYMQRSLSGALTIALFGFALMIFAGAVALFGSMKLDTLAKGLIGVAASLLIIGGASRLLKGFLDDMAALGAALVPLAFGLVVLAGAVALFGMIPLENMAVGLLGIFGALAILGASALLLKNVLPDLAAMGLALVPVALGLIGVGIALKLLSTISLEGVATSLLAIFGVLTIVGVAAYLAGPEILVLALALVPLAIGLMMIAAVLKSLDALGIEGIAIGLLGIVAVFAVIGIASMLLSEATPFILAFGLALMSVAAAFALFGAGVFLIGAGIAALAAGFRDLAALPGDAWDAIKNGLTELISLIPELATKLAEGLVDFLQVILDNAPMILEGFWTIMEMVLEAIPEFAPKFYDALVAIIDLIHDVIMDKSDTIIEAGMTLLLNFLQGIKDNIAEITTLTYEIIQLWMDSIAQQMPGIVTSAVNIIVAFIDGITQNMFRITKAAVGLIVEFINGLIFAQETINKKVLELILGFVAGVDKNIQEVIDAAVDVVVHFFGGMAKAVTEIANGAGKAILAMLDGIDKAILTYEERILAKGRGIAKHIVQGIINQLKETIINPMDYIDIPDVSVGLGPVTVGTGGIDVGGHQPPEASAAGEMYAISMVDAMIETFDRMSEDILFAMSNAGMIEPKVTPVLDLSNIHRDSDRLASLLGAAPISASLSTGQASVIATDEARRQNDAAQSDQVAVGPTQITFEQNNYARDELSLEDIYRNTKSQLTLAKEELGIR